MPSGVELFVSVKEGSSSVVRNRLSLCEVRVDDRMGKLGLSEP